MEERVLYWEDKSFDKDDVLKKFVHNLWFKPFPWEDKDIIAQILYNSKSVNEARHCWDKTMNDCDEGENRKSDKLIKKNWGNGRF